MPSTSISIPATTVSSVHVPDRETASLTGDPSVGDTMVTWGAWASDSMITPMFADALFPLMSSASAVTVYGPET